MHASGFKPLRHSGLSWLFWLAMLLPMAQAAAAWHGYSHLQRAAGEREEGKPAPHAAHCDLCLTASAMGSGAFAADPPGLAAVAVRHALPQPASAGVWIALPALAYLSRAPPPVPR